MLLDREFRLDLKTTSTKTRTSELLLYDYELDMIRIVDRLPTEEEFRRVRHLILQTPSPQAPPVESEGQEASDVSVAEALTRVPQMVMISDDQVAIILPSCPHLETVCLSGVLDTSDRTLVLLAANAINLQGLNVAGCTQVTDIGVLELTTKSLPLNWLNLNGVSGLTDSSISAIAKSCSRLIELAICDLPLLTPVAVRDIWSFSRKLRTLRTANNPLLSDKAFPSPRLDREPSPTPSGGSSRDKPLPHRPTTWLEQLPPLVLRHTAENLRVLDVSSCKITDSAIDGIVSHAPRVQSLNLSRCTALTDKALEYVARLGGHLDVLMIAHVSSVTDRGVVKIARECVNLRCVDVAFCRNLTDMSVFELAGLQSIQRLSLVRVQKLTDIGLFSLAEHATKLERLHLSYCDHLSLDAIHLLLRKLDRLQHLSGTGIPSLKRQGIQRFSATAPENYDADQKAVFCVFFGANVGLLRRFLDKEDLRRRDAEAQNVPFVPRSDDKLDLY